MNNILNEYSNLESKYKSYNEKMKILINDLIHEKNFKIHSITARIKDIKSLGNKLIKKGDKYHQLDDITDLSGVRLITYFDDDVDKIASLIKEEFDIDENNSVDKRKVIRPDSFGYLSLHFVIILKEPRSNLPEYSNYKNMKTEIQIRSILQHAWAEIEHDLGYKSSIAIPDEFRRKFSMIAGLLELADEQFCSIRDNFENYRSELIQKFNNNEKNIALNKDSLIEYVRNEKIVHDLDVNIVNKHNLQIIFSDGYLEDKIKLLNFINIFSVEDLDNKLKKYEDKIVNFGLLFFEKNLKFVNRGISIFYLIYVVIAEWESDTKIKEYLELLIGKNNKNFDGAFKKIKDVYSKMKV